MGSIVGVVLSGVICEYLDWRGVFYAFGALALLFSVIWWFFVHNNPSKYPNISDAELEKIFNGLDISKDLIEQYTVSYKLEKDENAVQKKKPTARKPGTNVPWLKLLTSKEVWVVAIAKFTLSWGNILLMSKLPSYLDRILHMPMQSNSMINAVIFLCLGLFALMFGALSDQIARKGWLSKLTSRKLFESIALFGSGGCLMLIPLAPCSSYMVVALMIASSCCYAAMTGGDNVIVCDLTTTHSGSLYGITNAVGSLPGFLAPIYVGFLLSIEESIYHWNLVYITSGLIAFFGGIIFLLFASCEPLDLESKPLLKTKLASIKSIKSIAADISIKSVKADRV